MNLSHSAAIVAAVEAGEDVNEVEAAGNTPLHSAAYEGWIEGAELLISLGAKVTLQTADSNITFAMYSVCCELCLATFCLL